MLLWCLALIKPLLQPQLLPSLNLPKPLLPPLPSTLLITHLLLRQQQRRLHALRATQAHAAIQNVNLATPCKKISTPPSNPVRAGAASVDAPAVQRAVPEEAPGLRICGAAGILRGAMRRRPRQC